MSATLSTSWKYQENASEFVPPQDNIQIQEVQKGVRYWGTHKRFVKRNQLLGFVEELGYDVDSIVYNNEEDDEEDEEGRRRE